MAFVDLLKIKGKKEEGRIVQEVHDLFDIKKDMARMMMERIWWRNFLYYCGEQWLDYMRSTQTFVRRILPPGASMPVSNKVREYVRAQKSMLLNQKLVPRIFPNTNERADEEAAKLGQEVLAWLDTLNEGEIDDEKEKCAIWTVCAGTTFMRSYPDKEAGELFLSPEGSVMYTGQVGTEHIIPFNVHFDSFGEKLNKKRWVGVETLKPREWVEDTFKVKIGQGESSTDMDYQRRLMKLVAQVSPWKGDSIKTSALDSDMEDLVIFREMEIRPTMKYFPDGRFLVTCQNKLLVDVERMPIKCEKGVWYYTLTDFHWNYVPGRFYSDSGVDDIISPQNTINKIDKALSDNRESIGRPRVLSPGELTLKRLTEKGESFLVLQYDPKTSGGVAPQFQPGTTYGPQVLEERRLAETSIQDSGGDPKNILKGVPPSASASGIQVDILTQTAEKGHYPDVDRWNRSMTRVYKKNLLLVKELFTEERLIKVVGVGGSRQVKNFKGADLKNNTDVRLELDSGLASTKAGQTQILSDLAQKGYLGDVQNDPEIRAEFLRRYGLSGFTGKENVDIERAESENSSVANGDISNLMLVEEGPMDPMTGLSGPVTILIDDPYFKYDNHALHYGVHRKYILGGEFRYLEEKARVVLMAHADYHQKLMMEEAQAQAAQAAAAAMAGSAGGIQPNEGGPVNA